MIEERWARHPAFPDYEVSDLGGVRRLEPGKGTRPGRLKAHSINATGYHTVMLGAKPRKVHALVLETFVGPRPTGCDACHINGNRADNALPNLRWGTRAENMADARAAGTDSRCDRHPAAKLTWAQVCDIRSRYAAGVTQKALAAEYGISRGHASYIINRGWKP